eukprot:14556505-Ditylum_brightwellii.AAC.1
MDIEVALVSEAAFGDKALKDGFYKKFDSDDLEMDEQLRLRREPTIYCAYKHLGTLCPHLVLAFSNDASPEYLTTNRNKSFVPELGDMAGYKHSTPLAHLIVGSSK